MQALDAVDHPLTSSTGVVVNRDMSVDIIAKFPIWLFFRVQFVPFNKSKGSMSRLTKAILAEIPMQLTQYMHVKGKAPNLMTDGKARMSTSSISTEPIASGQPNIIL